MLVDTSVWVDFFNGQDSAEALRLTRAVSDGETIRLAGIVVTEILLGLRTEAAAQRVASALEAFDWLPEPAREDYVEAAALYRRCRANGVTIRSTIDCLIARLCVRDEVPLLTRDRDFRAIARSTPLLLVEP